MKFSFLLLCTICLFSCSKDKLIGPDNLKNGQVVELLVDHKYNSTNDPLILLPKNEITYTALAGFSDRQPGYSYRVKARFHHEENPPQDGPSYWYDFLNIVSKEAYKGNTTFEIQLIYSYVVGGPTIQISKKDANYYFVPDKIQLTYTSDAIKNQLEEIWLHAKEIRESSTIKQPKWTSIKATVTHDPQKFGSAYLVQNIQFL
ncbi:hypothetical protein [Pedobacter sp. MW01-1-1]|uniref:hypothetical protein n=1 Tax=Pedobacter sp. MW01-1-1 TaxID=3383027 RepID=UPI003FEDFB05